MTLEFICSERIIKSQRISIPGRSNRYRLKSGIIKFFKSNPDPLRDSKEIPAIARKVSFENYQEHKWNINYGKPVFYDKKGKIIN